MEAQSEIGLRHVMVPCEMKTAMAKWTDLAKDNRLAAYEMNRAGRWRSCVSRAYYAIYSAATSQLVQHGVAMPKAYGNPSHLKLPTLVRLGFKTQLRPKQGQLPGLIRMLYTMRLAADYQPQVTVEAVEARQAISLMEQAFRCMEITR